jgi:ArsR family transcriptional regulator
MAVFSSAGISGNGSFLPCAAGAFLDSPQRRSPSGKPRRSDPHDRIAIDRQAGFVLHPRAPRSVAELMGLHLTFKYLNFNNMNVEKMIPASGRAAELLRSLSHPQRLLVLCTLGTEEKSVAEIRGRLGIDQVPMSQQLMRLRADGLVQSRRVGTTVYYRIARPEVLQIIGALYDAFCPSD